jgi:hypothetical protein
VSYVVQIWESPVPTSFEDADRICIALHAQRGEQNAKFVTLAERLMSKFRGPAADEEGEDVWTDVELDGECELPVYGVGILTEHLEKVLPVVVRIANALELVVFDEQDGALYLPDGRVLSNSARAQVAEQAVPAKRMQKAIKQAGLRARSARTRRAHEWAWLYVGRLST